MELKKLPQQIELEKLPQVRKTNYFGLGSVSIDVDYRSALPKSDVRKICQQALKNAKLPTFVLNLHKI
jgi:hypothetical protein